MVGNTTSIDRSTPYAGAIDCDLHPAVPGMKVLLPYLDDYWREMVSVRALDRLNLALTSYPQNAPLSCRPDWTLGERKKPGSSSLTEWTEFLLYSRRCNSTWYWYWLSAPIPAVPVSLSPA